ncbi:YadA-like family protein [Psychrobacter sp. DD43]|uniref:YadA-like family protein n=2 Tax=unclassified Psychrobacter TaxID=196806 RepID=UPI001917DDC4|nr:YadA-like family protein [Psychrobacter sp. DD43]
MNRIYKVIWNEALNCFTAVGEYAKARGKSSKSSVSANATINTTDNLSSTSAFKITAIGLGLMAAGFCIQASAIPNNGNSSNHNIDYPFTHTHGLGEHTHTTNNSHKKEGDNSDTSIILEFEGDIGDPIALKQGETLHILGGETDANNLSNNDNIGVVADGDILMIKLAKDIDLDADGSVTMGDTLVDNSGITITNTVPAKIVSLTSAGLNNGGNQITNVASGGLLTDPNNQHNAATIGDIVANQIKYVSINSTGGTNEDNLGAQGADAIAIGKGASAVGQTTVAIGLNSGAGSTAYTEQGVSVGNASGQNVLSSGNVGIGASAGSNVSATPRTTVGGNPAYRPYSIVGQNTAIGAAAGNGVYGDSNSALGERAGRNVDGHANTAIGAFSGNAVIGSANVAMGPTAGYTVTGDRNTAVGNFSGSHVVGKVNSAFGNGAGSNVTGEYNLALGAGAGAGITNDLTVAIGNNAGNFQNGQIGKNSISVGTNSSAQGHSSMALGRGSVSAGINAIGIGVQSIASATGTIAVGDRAEASGENAIAIGKNSLATGSQAIGVGSRAGNGGAAYGDNADAGGTTMSATPTVIKGTAIGNGSIVNVDNGVALGSKSVANRTATGSGTVFVPTSASGLAIESTRSTALGAVSVGNNVDGNRQIVNVAAGRDDSDAVNVSQLRALDTIVAGIDFPIRSSNAKPYTTSVTGTDALAVGSNAIANGDRSTAVGENAKAIGIQASAFGAGAEATARSSLASGFEAKAKSGESVALGVRSSAEGLGATAVGPTANARGEDSVALGRRSKADGAGAMALGGFSEAVGENASAVGFNAEATNKNATAIGVNAKALGERSVAIGEGAQATTLTGTAIGSRTRATGIQSTAVGVGSKATKQWSTAMGFVSEANGLSSVALGDRSIVGGKESIAIGKGNTVNGANSIAVGVRNKVSGTRSGAFGSQLPPDDIDSVSGNSSYSVGNDNTVENDNSFVLGNNVSTTQNNSVVLGNLSTDRAATTETGVIINTRYYTYTGQGSAAKGVVSVGFVNGERQIINVAAGAVNENSTDAINGSQLYATNQSIEEVNDTANKGWFIRTDSGDGAKSNVKPDDVVTINGDNKNISVTNVGNDLIVALSDDINVGTSGIDGKDGFIGVNGKDGVSGVAINGSNGTIGLTGPTGVSGTIGVINGVPGVNGGDGITRIVIDDIQVATMEDGLKFAGNTGTTINKKLNETLSIEGKLANAADASGANLRVDSLNGKLNVVMAKNLTDLDTVTVGSDPSNQTFINRGTISSKALNVNAGRFVVEDDKVSVALGTNVSMGGNQVHNVVAGAAGTDAVNVDQLNGQNSTIVTKGLNFAGNDNINIHKDLGTQLKIVGSLNPLKTASAKNIRTVENNGQLEIQMADALDVTSVTTGNTVMDNGGVSFINSGVKLNSTGFTITNIVPAKTVSLTSTGLNNGGNVITNVARGEATTDAVNVGQLNEVKQSAADANKGWNLSAQSNESTISTVKPSDTVDLNNTDNNITVSKTAESNNVTFNLSRDIAVDSVQTGDATMNSSGLTIVGGPKLTKTSVDAGGNKITNVANGFIEVASKDAVNGGQLFEFLSLVNTQTTVIAEMGAGLNFDADSGPVINKKAGSAPLTFKGGNNITTTSAGSSIKFDLNGNINVDSVTTGDTTVSTNGVVIAGGPSITKAGIYAGNGETAPSMTAAGINAAGTKITNVADGMQPRDAVNFGQLDAVNRNLGNSINELGYRIGEVEDDANAGISAAMAMSSLPQAYIIGKSMIGGGIATYNGESAVAIGFSKLSADGRWVMKLNGTADTQGNVGAAIGAGFHFD